MNLPNKLTISRFILTVAFLVVMFSRMPYHETIALVLFSAAGISDYFDGRIARQRKLITNFGILMDPLADKLLVLSVLIVLVQEGLVAAWIVVVIFSRELLITILRSVGASQGQVIGAAPLGKTKTITQMAAVALLILQRPYPVLVPVADIAVLVAVVFTIFSGIDYLVRFRHLIGLGEGASGSQPSVDPLSRELGDLLVREGLTVAVAESCTGGLLGYLITEKPGSSAYFLGGVIAYADEVKREELGVPAALLSRHGAVSREVALAMAEGARTRFGAGLAASITCIAGPDANGTTKPVGLTYIAVASEGDRRCEEYSFTGDRWSNRRQAAAQALHLLIAEVRAKAGRRA